MVILWWKKNKQAFIFLFCCSAWARRSTIYSLSCHRPDEIWMYLCGVHASRNSVALTLITHRAAGRGTLQLNWLLMQILSWITPWRTSINSIHPVWGLQWWEGQIGKRCFRILRMNDPIKTYWPFPITNITTGKSL